MGGQLVEDARVERGAMFADSRSSRYRERDLGPIGGAQRHDLFTHITTPDLAGDEVAVLRRERKRRLDAAEQFRAAGREDFVASEEAEAELIGGYLPAELGDEELRAIVVQAVADAYAAMDERRAIKALLTFGA